MHRQIFNADEVARRLMTVPGIGPLIATAIAVPAPPPETFRKTRDFAAWLGLTPRQHSTGGEQRLGATTKMGERSLRRLIIGAASNGTSIRAPDWACGWAGCLVGDQDSGVDVANRRVGAVQTAGLSGRQMKAGRIAQRITGRVDIGAQPVPRPPDQFGFSTIPSSRPRADTPTRWCCRSWRIRYRRPVPGH